MQEALRLEMLEAIGVKPLLPRYRFTLAKNSQPPVEQLGEPIVDEPMAYADVSEIPAITEDISADVAPVSSRSAALSEELSVLDSIKHTLAGTTAETSKPLRFRLRFVRVGELLMLLSQPALEWKEQKPAQQFFQDIYWALSGKRAEFWNEAQFEWPPSKQFPFAADVDMARQTLLSFLQQQMQQPPAQWVLAWGEEAVEQLLDEAAGVGEVAFCEPYKILQLKPLNSYWQEPQSKALLWQQLQVVRKAMSIDA